MKEGVRGAGEQEAISNNKGNSVNRVNSMNEAAMEYVRENLSTNRLKEGYLEVTLFPHLRVGYNLKRATHQSRCSYRVCGGFFDNGAEEIQAVEVERHTKESAVLRERLEALEAAVREATAKSLTTRAQGLC
jgi:hypothetical protein